MSSNNSKPLITVSIGEAPTSRARRAMQFVPGYSKETTKKPAHFTATEARHYAGLVKKLTEIGLDSTTFEKHIWACAEFMALADELKRKINKLRKSGLGLVYNERKLNGDVIPVMRPEVAYLLKVEDLIRKYHNELGLTPVAHAALGKRRARTVPLKTNTEATVDDWGDL